MATGKQGWWCARVLIVDDEATLVDTIRYNLRREGYDVQAANDGNEALRLAKATTLDRLPRSDAAGSGRPGCAGSFGVTAPSRF